jgi:hypothetical protein
MSDNLYRQALCQKGFSFTRIMFHAFCLLRRPDRAAFFLAGMRREFAFHPDSSLSLRRSAVAGLQLPEMQRTRTQPASRRSAPIPYARRGTHELRLGRRPPHSHVRIRPVTQSGGMRFESIVWTVSCLVVILGVVHAAHSQQPLLWLAVWPAPVVVACTIFTFFRHGFHFEDGLLVLGRQRD